MRSALLVGLLVLPAAISNQEVVVEVGQSVVLDLGYRPIETICDDISIVEVEPIFEAIRFTGLKEGTTACSFRKIGSIPGPVTVIHVVPGD